jgi:hypothetical protein
MHHLPLAEDRHRAPPFALLGRLGAGRAKLGAVRIDTRERWWLSGVE